ncbi:MAG: serine/threonine protein kinase [Myxococcales bacterium]|nr:serine/threonine protein kinase [Myxococcales bacterium]
MQVNREQLVEDSVFILQCLRQNAKGGRQSALDELEGSVALEPAAYVAFLERFGYVEVEQHGIRVTAQGERAATGAADVSRDVQDHFRQVIQGVHDTQPQIESPQVKPVEGHLGQGPSSYVRAARLGELGLMVALKEYKPLWEWLPWLSPAELSRRIRREAQAQAALGHPCVLQILEVRGGEEAQVIMPLAAGTLRDKLSRSERMPSWHALRIAAQVAHALAHAHGQGLVHGALKPENVLLDRAGNTLLSDFGAARLVALPVPTRAGPRVQVELGDVRYRAPEVSASEPAGMPADAFALGTLLHEMLAGAPDGALPADLPAPSIELLDELRHPEAARRPALSAAATRLARLLAPHSLFAL